MSELRGLLELLYLARTRWRTVRLTMDDWTHLDRQEDAYERSLGLEGTSPPHAYGEIEAMTRTWVDADGPFRQERQGMTLVHDGTRSWIATAESGVMEHESQGLRPLGEELLDPAAFLPGFDLRLAGETVDQTTCARGDREAKAPRCRAGRALPVRRRRPLAGRRPRARGDPALRGERRR